MSQAIAKARIVHAQVVRTYEGVTNGGWNTTLRNKQPGDWAAIDSAGRAVALCLVSGCGVQLTLQLTPATERAEFARRHRIRRAKMLAVALILAMFGAFLQWLSKGEAPLIIPGAALSLIGTVSAFCLLLMLLFGGRTQRYRYEILGQEPEGVAHQVETSP